MEYYTNVLRGMKMNKQQIKVLICCCICMAGSIGIVSNCTGIFFTPISKDLSLQIGTVSVISTLVSMSLAFFTPVASKLLERFGYGKAMAAGGFVAFVAYMVSSFASNVYLLYVTGIVIGAAASLFSALPVTILINDYFKENSGTPIGIAMAFSGVGGAVLNPLASKIITSYGWRMTYRVLGMLFLLFVVPCAIGLKRGEPFRKKVEAKDLQTTNKLSMSMLVIVILISFCYKAICGLNSHVSSYAIECGYTLQFGATLVSTSMIGNVLFKLINGKLSDFIGPFNTTIFFCGITLLGCVGLVFLNKNSISLMLSVFMYASAFSIGNVGYTMMIRKVAKDDYARVYSITTVFGTTGYALMTSVLGFLRDGSGSYKMPIMVIMIFGVLALSGTIFIKHKVEE